MKKLNKRILRYSIHRFGTNASKLLAFSFYLQISSFPKVKNGIPSAIELPSSFNSLASRTVLVAGLYLLVSLGLSAQSLQDHFQIAAENNPGLQAKYKEFEAALEKVPQAKSLQDPTLSFGYFISPVETRVGPQRARFSLSQMFPWYGTLKAQGDAAALLADARYQAFLEARNRLYYQVAATYYPLYELYELQRLERANIDLLESYKNLSIRQFESGRGSMADVLRVDIMLKDAETNLKILRDKEKSLISSFNALLGRSPEETIVVPDTLIADQLPEMFHDFSKKDSLLANNPVLKELEYQVAASEANERVAVKQGLPKVGIGFDYVVVDKRTDITLPDNGKDVFMPMVSISLPISRVRYKAAEKEAQLMQKSNALRKADYANNLVASLEAALFNTRQQRTLIALYDAQVQEAEQVLNLLFVEYSNSGQDFEEVLQLQQQLLKYEKMKVEALTAYHISIAELNYIVGDSVMGNP